jgi:hypothetical protein
MRLRPLGASRRPLSGAAATATGNNLAVSTGYTLASVPIGTTVPKRMPHAVYNPTKKMNKWLDHITHL